MSESAIIEFCTSQNQFYRVMTLLEWESNSTLVSWEGG